MTDQSRARELAERALDDGDATGWFDEMYAEDESAIPWARSEPNPHLVSWLDERAAPDADASALVVGCGLGHDVEELRRRGYDATGFDVSPRAVERCRERFPESTADYRVADLFDAPDAWTGAFDLVVESYTLQALPPAERDRAVDPVADFLAPGGTLVVVCRGRDTDEEAGRLPWPLTREQVLAFEAAVLELLTFDDFSDDREPPVRRFRAVFRRPA